MREYKFRGKRIDNGKWTYGFYYKYEVPGEIHHYMYRNAMDDCSVDPETVGQYAGIRDRNGNEVYEGDILRVPDLYETPENTVTTYHSELVGFNRCAFTLGGQPLPLTEDADYVSDECEVIGNIYDNPDLLEASV